jgi:predicted AlkP superfamily phosphohydrolase/phosphomutase
MTLDWQDIAKLGGGFGGGIFAMWLKAAVQDHYKNRSDSRKAILDKRIAFVDGVTRLIQDAYAVTYISSLSNQRDSDMRSKAISAITAMSTFVERQRPYLPDYVWDLLHGLEEKLFDVVLSIGAYYERDESFVTPEFKVQQKEVLEKARTILEKEIPDLRRELEKEYIAMLRVQTTRRS